MYTFEKNIFFVNEVLTSLYMLIKYENSNLFLIYVMDI